MKRQLLIKPQIYLSCLDKHFLNRENEKMEREREMERKIKREMEREKEI